MEVSPELYSNLSVILKKFKGFYERGLFIQTFGVSCGQAIFLSNKIKIIKNGKQFIYRQSPRDLGFMQHAELRIGEKKIWLGSVHGKTLPGSKLDTPVRLKQSQKIIDLFANKNCPKIIGGDFNLMPDTKSVKMIEEAGYRNLIRDFDIQETRNNLCWKQFPEDKKQHFADYVFVSKDVKVDKFEVPYNEISDHLPQILNFEI